MEDKSAPNSATKVSFQHNYYMFVSRHDSDHDDEISQNIRRSFLEAVSSMFNIM